MSLDISQSRIKWLIAIVIFIVTLIVISIFVFKKPEKTASMIAVTKGSIAEQAEAVGYIKTRDFSTVKSQVDGIVEIIYHEEGEYITKNTPLIKIKPAPRPAEYAQAHKDLVSDITAEKQAKIDLERQQHLLKTGVISKNDHNYIAAKKDYDLVKNQKILSEQKLALLTRGETIVGGKSIASVVNSPIDGYVLYRNVNVGDPIISISSSQSATPLFIVANMKDLIFQGVVDERDAARIKVGMKAEITVGSLPDHKITGTISRIALQSEKENQALTSASSYQNNSSSNSPFNVGFKIEIADLQLPKDLVLRSGYSATASIELKKVEDVLMLPLRLIQFKDDKSYVLLPAKKGKKPEEQPVELGISDNINTEIKSGLKLGDQVIDQPDPTVITQDK